MKTPIDFASVLLFAVIAVIFLHRSATPGRDPVPIWVYAVTAITCAAGDVLANDGNLIIGALLVLVAVGGGIWIAFRKSDEEGQRR